MVGEFGGTKEASRLKAVRPVVKNLTCFSFEYLLLQNYWPELSKRVTMYPES